MKLFGYKKSGLELQTESINADVGGANLKLDIRGMKTYVQDLITRMSDDSYRKGETSIDGMYESEKTISWAAHEEARTLSNLSLNDELINIIEQADDANIKGNAYFVLGCNAKNTNSLSVTDYLLSKLVMEEDVSLLLKILSRLSELYKPKASDTSELYKLTNHRNWRVRRAAFSALTNNEEKVEGFLIERLATSLNDDDIWSLINALGYVGTTKSIPFIERHLKHRKQDIKGAAIKKLILIMIREGYANQDIRAKTGVSNEYVDRLRERIELLTRCG